MSAFSHTDLLDRARGCLFGIALGDAMGMPTQTLTREISLARYGVIEDFVAPFDDHPVSHGLLAAQVTDDTEQAILLAQRLIQAPGAFDPKGWAQDLLDWEADVKKRGLRDLLGPSSKAALDAISIGVNPEDAAKKGTTNGAAMRIPPVGIAQPAGNISALIDKVEQTCRVTHFTGEAIAGSAAVAAAISALVEGAKLTHACNLAVRASRLGQSRGSKAGVDDMPDRISKAIQLAESGISPIDLAANFGTSVASHESVPTAFGLFVLSGGDVWRTAVMAANIGDDTDTIGAISCAMCGAASGVAGFPPDKLATLKSANTLNIETIALGLIALRESTEWTREGVES